jgi:nicotinate-nucleotide pyrophosphorylase (carboxylating)
MTDFDERLQHLIESALAEDIGDGDHSTLAVIPKDARGKAVLRIKQDGILAGVAIARQIFSLHRDQTILVQFKNDGDVMSFGETAFEVETDVQTILERERLVLNCMQRMSGIATLTHQYVERLTGYKTRILDTRKTTPNFRLLEKEAVRIGGGVNHRFGLYDMIMLKDNHIDYCGGIEKAIVKASDYILNRKPGLKIEIETRNLDDVREVLRVGRIDRIMLDNFTPVQIAGALKMIDGQFETEASGGINLDNITSFAETGVDFISAGSLIHQARSLDLSLKAVLL